MNTIPGENQKYECLPVEKGQQIRVIYLDFEMCSIITGLAESARKPSATNRKQFIWVIMGYHETLYGQGERTKSKQKDVINQENKQEILCRA